MARKKRRGRPHNTRTPTSMTLLAGVQLATAFGVKRQTAVKQQLHELGLPTDKRNVDRVRTLSRNHQPLIEEFLAKNGFKKGGLPPGLEPIFDPDRRHRPNLIH
jgi:hypothetical protein